MLLCCFFLLWHWSLFCVLHASFFATTLLFCCIYVGCIAWRNADTVEILEHFNLLKHVFNLGCLLSYLFVESTKQYQHYQQHCPDLKPIAGITKQSLANAGPLSLPYGNILMIHNMIPYPVSPYTFATVCTTVQILVRKLHYKGSRDIALEMYLYTPK